MAHTLTEVTAFDSTVTVPDDGDSVTGGSIQTPCQSLADRTNFLNSAITASLVTSSAGTTVLSSSSSTCQILTGSANQTFKLPDETTLAVGAVFEFINNSSGILTVQDSAGSTLATIQGPSTTNRTPYLRFISTSAGGATGGWVFSPSYTPGQIQATSTNDSATAGNIGELFYTSLGPASAIGSGGCTVNIGSSFALTSGVWRASGFAIISVTSQIYFGLSTSSAAFSNTSEIPDSTGCVRCGGASGSNTVVIPPYTFSIASPATYYSVATSDFGGTDFFTGWMQVERAR